MNRFLSISSRRVAFLAGAALLCATLAMPRVLAVPVGAQKSPQQLLQEARNAMRNTSYQAVQLVQPSGRAATQMRVWNGNGKRRYQFLSPAVRRGDIIVDNGNDMWIYHRSDNSAVQTRSAKRSLREIAARGAQVKRSGVATIEGRKTTILDVSPKNAARGRRRMWIDDKTRLPLRIERFDGRGARMEVSKLQNVRFGAVPASTFVWSPPVGARVTRTNGAYFPALAAAQRAASWLQFPRTLRNGFAFESAIVDGARGEAWLRYTNANQRFSIFQQRASGADKARRKVGNVWFWQRGGNRFTIVGLPDAQAAAIINSVK